MTAPALFFHPDAIESAGKDLVGRRSAGQSFLKGFLAHVPGDQVGVVTQTKAGIEGFRKLLAEMGETRPVDGSVLRGQDFTRHGTIFFPGPGYMDATWRRQRYQPNACSLVGITHTVSTRRVMEGMHRLLIEPVEPWDAIICTSRAVHAVVARQMEEEAAFLKDRFQAGRVPLPQLPIIPLGIQTADFAPRDGARAAMRTRFGASDATIVVMTMGRLTAVEKANPAPMLIALEEVAQTTGADIHLWQVGWASREDEAKLHEDAPKHLAPSVTVHTIDGRDPAMRRDIWAGADIFTLAVDNIQETFGLVPVEAMAAGLPVIMPDWNGFRDTVRHGETGFLLPTRTPPPGMGLGQQLARRFADGTDDYLRHLSLLQQQTQIDVRAYVEALTTLVTDPAKRQAMGAAGNAHVRAQFDWRAVIPQYIDLTKALAEQRQAGTVTTPGRTRTALNPLEIDPLSLYRAYPSAVLAPGDLVTPHKPLDAATLTALDAVNGRTLYTRRVIPDEKLLAFADLIAQLGPVTVQDLNAKATIPTDVVVSAVLFLAKYDFVMITPAASN